jgi:hypothetical protein
MQGIRLNFNDDVGPAVAGPEPVPVPRACGSGKNTRLQTAGHWHGVTVSSTMINGGCDAEERAAGSAFVYGGGVKVARSRSSRPVASRAVGEAEQETSDTEASFGDDEDSDRGDAARKRKRFCLPPSALEDVSAGEPCERSRAACIDTIVAEGNALVLAESDSALYVGARYRPETTMAMAVHTTKARNTAIQKGKRAQWICTLPTQSI